MYQLIRYSLVLFTIYFTGASELTKLYLYESYQLPVLLYTTESLNEGTTAIRKLYVLEIKIRQKFLIDHGKP